MGSIPNAEVSTMNEESRRQMQEAVEDPGITKIYFNGFSCAIGLGDVLISLTLNGQTVTVLNASYTVAKTLVQKLGGVINHLEEESGNTIMTTDQVAAHLGKNGESRE